MRLFGVGILFLAALGLRAEGWGLAGHVGALMPGCGMKAGLHGEDWGVAAGLAVTRDLGPRSEARLEVGFGGLSGRASSAHVNVERLAIMACFRHHPFGGRPFLAVALGASRYRSHLSEQAPEPPPAAERRPLFSLDEAGALRPGIAWPGARASTFVPGEETGLRPAMGFGLGLGFGRHLETEVRWEAMTHRGRTLGVWQVRAGFRF